MTYWYILMQIPANDNDISNDNDQYSDVMTVNDDIINAVSVSNDCAIFSMKVFSNTMIQYYWLLLVMVYYSLFITIQWYIEMQWLYSDTKYCISDTMINILLFSNVIQ